MGKAKKGTERTEEKKRQATELAARTMSTAELAALLVRAKEADGERYCFILGSGASVESGIRAGNELEMAWMNCLMGKEADRDGMPPMDAAAQEKRAEALHGKGMLKYPFAEIKGAWEKAVKEKKATLPSEYYFDIYSLRFYTAPQNGYRYLEREMDDKEPSLGYLALALLLTESHKNNLVITTNFDSLTEDALFLYTQKKPLVISHEALAGFIDANVQRPVIAKVHRGLLFEPFNRPEMVGKLQEGWKGVLTTLFKLYTPIVVGYGGGDHSLMDFLTTADLRGLYWCYRGELDDLDERVKELLIDKNGYLVKINGFDDLMLTLGAKLYPEKMSPTAVTDILGQQWMDRNKRYEERYNMLAKQSATGDAYRLLENSRKQAFAQQEEAGKLTAWDYYWRAMQFYNRKDYPKAIEDYGKALELDPDMAAAYNSRGNVYRRLKDYDKAIANYNKALEVRPDDATVHNNRGVAYWELGKRDMAIADFNKALELKPNLAEAYDNFGEVCWNLGEYDKAIENCTKALELKPDMADAYHNRAIAYRKRHNAGDEERAEADEATYKKLTSKE